MWRTISDLDLNDSVPRTFGFDDNDGEDTSAGFDGRTRVLGYVLTGGVGAVAVLWLGHRHSP